MIILLPALHFKHDISSLDRFVGGGEVFILEFFLEKQDKKWQNILLVIKYKYVINFILIKN